MGEAVDNGINEVEQVRYNNEGGIELYCAISVTETEFGISFYSTLSHSVEMLQVSLIDSLESICNKIFSIRKPTCVLLNARITEDVSELICSLLPPNARIVYQKPTQFDYMKGLLTIQSICHQNQKNTDNTNETEIDGIHYYNLHTSNILLHSLLDTAAKELVRSMGCLLSFISLNAKKDQFESDPSTLFIQSFLYLSTEKYMLMDYTSFQSLDIFTTDQHPSLIKGLGRDKQGFTIYTLLDRTVCPLGRKLLKQWILCPSCDVEEITQRQNTIAFFQQPQVRELGVSLQKELSRVVDIPLVCSRLIAYKGIWNDWVRIVDTVDGILEIGRVLGIMIRYSNPTKVGDNELIRMSPELLLDEQIQKSSLILHQVIDYKNSKERKELIINEGVDDVLDQYYSLYSRMSSILEEYTTETMQLLLQRITSLRETVSFQEWSYEYLPRIGYVFFIPMRSIHELQINPENYLHPSFPNDFVYQFHTEDSVYYKTAIATKLDKEYGDLYSIIVDLQNNVMRQLALFLASVMHLLLNCSSVLAEIDVLLAWSIVCFECNFVKPEIVSEPTILVKNGRHPLQELVVERFIPNDITIRQKGEQGMVVVTGPNNSGKSIYLKQIALIIYMNQIGCYVPADAAILSIRSSFHLYASIIHRIYTKFSLAESVIGDDSSFTQDVTRIAYIVRHIQPNALVIIDEYGKGTIPQDGIALFLSCVHHFCEMKDPSSFFVLSTHFSEYLQPDLLPKEGVVIDFLQMNVLLEENKDNILTPLYQVTKGICRDSLGIRVAALLGMPETIISRASELHQCFLEGTVVPLHDASTSAKKNQISRILSTLFQKEDWNKISTDELRAFLDMLKEL